MKTVHLKAIIPEELAGRRLDQALASLFPEHSRARLQNWIKSNHVLIDGKHLKPRDKVTTGQQIEVNAKLIPEERWQPQAIKLDIVYEDGDLLVINKPAGLVVHPAAGNPDKTLVNAVLHHAKQCDLLPRAGIVHRIDKDTTGLLVVAKTLVAHTSLVNQIQERTAKRQYLALVIGKMISGGSIDAPMARHPKNRIKMAIVEGGKPATTHYRVAERFNDYTLLNVELDTGRTHQIRVHMTSINHPLVGDQVYGGRLKFPADCSDALKKALRDFKRQALHARHLELLHPTTHEAMRWDAPIPEDMQNLLGLLRKNNE